MTWYVTVPPDVDKRTIPPPSSTRRPHSQQGDSWQISAPTEGPRRSPHGHRTDGSWWEQRGDWKGPHCGTLPRNMAAGPQHRAFRRKAPTCSWAAGEETRPFGAGLHGGSKSDRRGPPPGAWTAGVPPRERPWAPPAHQRVGSLGTCPEHRTQRATGPEPRSWRALELGGPGGRDPSRTFYFQ